MTPTRQILFIQGGGAGAYDERDAKLAESLRRKLGSSSRSATRACPAKATQITPGGARRSGASWRTWTVLIAAPSVGDGGWPGGEFELTSDLGERLPPGVRVHVFHRLQNQTAPPSHTGQPVCPT